MQPQYAGDLPGYRVVRFEIWCIDGFSDELTAYVEKGMRTPLSVAPRERAPVDTTGEMAA